MSTVVVRDIKKSQNSLEIIQQQIETIATQIEEVNKAKCNLEKRITELREKQEEDKNRESIEKTTVEDQEQNESVDGQITQSGQSGITDLEVGSIVDASKISMSSLDSYFQAYEIVEGDALQQNYRKIIQRK